MCDMDISCTKCGHREVCALKDEFEKAQKAVHDCSVSLDKEENGYSFKNLRDYDWIEPVKLRCKHFIERKPPVNFRDIAP